MLKTKIDATFFLAVLFVVSVSVFFIPAVSCQNGKNVTVHFIDVGQGDSIFIDTSNLDVLIDGGSASAAQVVLDYLGSLNITRIHLMIGTHAHADHIGGLVSILHSALTIDTVIANNQTYSSVTSTNFMNLANTHNLTVAQRGQTFILTETANLTIFNPVQPLEFSDANDNSVVAKLQVEATSFLFTGDAEEDAEHSMITAGVNLQSDVLKVGHHGSYTTTSQSFLDIMSLSYAIICAGDGNTYGHPHNVTIQKLLTKGVTIYGTITSGTIVATTDGTTITFQDNPQSIPEFPTNIILTLIIVTTLLATILYQKKLPQI